MKLNPFRKPDRHLKNWCIEAEDITGRWNPIPGEHIRKGLADRGVLIYAWADKDGLDYDQVVAVVKKCVQYGTWGHPVYSNRSIRIRNLKTGDFMPFEILGIELPKRPELGAEMATGYEGASSQKMRAFMPLDPPLTIDMLKELAQIEAGKKTLPPGVEGKPYHPEWAATDPRYPTLGEAAGGKRGTP